jgi:hypothetical protein
MEGLLLLGVCELLESLQCCGIVWLSISMGEADLVACSGRFGIKELKAQWAVRNGQIVMSAGSDGFKIAV